MKVMICSSWSEAGFELYGRRWLETAGEHWDGEIDINVVNDSRLKMDNQFVAFMLRHAAQKLDPKQPGYDYRHDLLRFAHKVFALKVALEDAVADGHYWLVWLDGDV